MSAAARAPLPPISPDESSVETHLRRILETQPVCLARLTIDGVFLAVNDAALSLLGTEQLDQVLDTSLFDLLTEPFRDPCRVFLKRVAAGERGSTEVGLTGLGGLSHTAELHAIPYPPAADGIPAVLCAFRDVTEYRRLERELVEAAAREDQAAAAHAAERATLSAAIADTHAEADARAGSVQARVAALEQQLADAERRHHEAAERHTVQQAQLKAELDAAQQQLEAAVADHLARLTEIEGELRAAQARERELTEHHQHADAVLAQVREAAGAHEREAATLRETVARLEASASESQARERELIDEQHRLDAVLARAGEQTAAHEREAATLRDTIERLEAAAQADERERLDERHQREAAHAQAIEHARAEHAQQAAALQQQIEHLEGSIETLMSEHGAAVRALESERATSGAQRVAAEAERLTWTARLDRSERLAHAGRAAQLTLPEVAAALAGVLDHARALASNEAADAALRVAAEHVVAASATVATLVGRLQRDLAAAAEQTTAVGPIVQALEPALAALLSPDISLALLPGSVGAHVPLGHEQLEQIALTLAASRRAAMNGGGQVSLELAEVDLDEDCARERFTAPGPYVLLALHAKGPAVRSSTPPGVVGVAADARAWRGAGPGMGALHQMISRAGGHLWASYEDPDGVAFELYLPRLDPPPDPKPAKAGRHTS